MENFYTRYGKRILDIVLATLALVGLSIVFLILILLIQVRLGRPIFFKQERAGLDGKSFTLYKFRSMTNERNREGKLLTDAERLSPLGIILRSTSLDELPSLLNIIKGQMSLVGPRPLDYTYLPYFTASEKVRHSVKPGLTGLAQIKGRNALSWEERFEYDLSYARKISFLLDLEIIMKTVSIVLKRSDIGSRGEGVLIDFDLYRQKVKEDSDEWEKIG